MVRTRHPRFALVALLAVIAMVRAVQGAGTAAWQDRIERHLMMQRDRTLQACNQRGIALPADFLAWIDADPVRRESVWGCRADPLPVVLALRSLEMDLGTDTVRRDYPQLALAFALQDSYLKRDAVAGRWNDADGAAKPDGLPNVTPRAPLALQVPGDPRVKVDTKDATRPHDLDDDIVNFLEDHAPIEVQETVDQPAPLEYDEHGVAKPRGKPVKSTRTVKRPLVAADVIASAALQREFNDCMQAHGHAERIDCGDGAVSWNSTAAVKDADLRKRIVAAHQLFEHAYRAKGRMPAERDRAPTAAESMAWLIRNDRWPFTPEARAARHWPLFPLDAPWPTLLMLAADDQPLREREEIWCRFRDAGELRTYGEYIGDIAQQFDMQSARRLAPFAHSYGSIEMMWKDGGVCGTMGNIGARTRRIVGVPASTAGQPGHCALVLWERDPDTGKFRCRGDQYATGGDEVTNVHAGWNYDDRGGRRPMVFHQSVAWGVNAGFESFVQTLVLRRVFDAMPPAERAECCEAFMREGLSRNPYAMPVVEAAMEQAPDVATALRMLDSFDAMSEQAKLPAEHRLYRDAVRDLAHARILALAEPSPSEAQSLLGELMRQRCANAALLARCWRQVGGEEGFLENCVQAARDYVASPSRTTDRDAANAFTKRVKDWGRTIQAKEARQAWALAMLEAFKDHEVIQRKSKVSLDPAVAELCRMAGRDPPKVPK